MTLIPPSGIGAALVTAAGSAETLSLSDWMAVLDPLQLMTFGALLSSGPAPSTPGTGYAPGDGVTLAGGTYTSAATLRVTQTKVVAATVAAGGSGGSNGTQTVTGTTGTAGIGKTRFSASVTVSGGAITAVNSITVAGGYITNPTDITQEPVTGASLTGAKLNLTMGADAFQVQTQGIYSRFPTSPVSQASTTGTGTGATFPIGVGPIASNMLFPPLNENHVGGADNFSLGNGALGSLTTGYFNLAIGINALAANTTGPESVAIGWNSAQNYVGTGGTGNITIGTASGRALTTGTNNVAIGTDALNTPTTASNNVVVGQAAVNSSDIGNGNVIVGDTIGKYGTSARISNVIIGSGAMVGKSDNTSAYNRMTVVGKGALSGANLASPARTVVVGDVTGGSAFASSDSVLIGSTAGNSITSGSNQVIIGSNAGAAVTTGASNVIIGKNVAQTTLQSGSNNVLIGTSSSIDAAAAGTSNTIQIGAGSTATWSATGCGTPSTSLSTVAGNLGVGTAGIAAAILALAAGTTAKAQINLPVSTAPSAPADGDMWREDNTNTGLKIRINGVTKTITVS